MNTELYPLKFYPILKEKVWGGKKLKQLFGKEREGIVGESWELSGVEDDVSIIANGALSGRSLTTVLEKYKEQLMGARVFSTYATKFPLLFKFIDAAQDLSVQLHPGDALAKERHNSFGKTEMWYILQAEENSRLILGFDQQMDEETYLKKLSENELLSILNEVNVTEGDAFFIGPGTVHAIGAGIVLAEIQQTSDVTYRIYDWDRPDTDGTMRQLHTQESIQAINYNASETKLEYASEKNKPALIKSTPYFETNRIAVSEAIQRDFSKLDSFVVYMCVKGNAVIAVEGHSEKIKIGETLLIPACFPEVNISANSAVLLEVYIK